MCQGGELAVKIMLLILLLLGGQRLQAQGYYTITNGHYYWFDGRESDPDDSKYLTGWDKGNSWAAIYKLGTHATESPTEIVAQGDTYLTLDTTTTPGTPRVSYSSTIGFNPLCVWYRTGKTGNYYQEWGNYRYYLYASHSEGLSIYKVEAGQPLAKKTTWYDWDHGCATMEETDVPGGKKTSYYWLIFDNLNDADGTEADPPVWRMSTVSCYQRPEEMIYNHYRADGAGGNTWDGKGNGDDDGISYYDNVRIGPKNYPAGLGGTFMAVTKEDKAQSISSMPEEMGLKTLVLGAENITLGQSTTVTANIFTNTSDKIPVQITPAYTIYNEETYRRGINLNADSRTSNEFGSAGVPTIETHYWYDGVDHASAPSSASANLTIESVEFSITPHARRYLTIGSATDADPVTEGGKNKHAWSATIECIDIPLSPVNAIITATVHYSNGQVQELTTIIEVRYTKNEITMYSRRAPAIKGSVFGGGKMANVTGNTAVTVHSADSIYAVYGGNDIAGWVQGSNGATIQIGTTQTNEDRPIHIGWVYGGGCGYYRYGQTYDATTPGWHDAGQKASTVGYGEYCFKGGVYDWNDPTVEVVAPGTFDYDPYTGENFAIMEDGNRTVDGKLAGTVPYIKTAHITIGVPEVNGHYDSIGHNAHEHNDNILIDSLFGGAENAFIGMTTSDLASAVTLDVNGGTILAAFGGNNYGGSVAQTAKVNIDVNCTKLTDDEHYRENSFFHGAGRDYGIRHLFGGGNKVSSTHAEVHFHGGQVDTAFIGGNSATVENPIGLVEALHDGIEYDYKGFAKDDPEYCGTTFMNGHFIWTNPTLQDTSLADLRDRNKNLGYTPDNGLYNVRFLFGGNNQADMENVSFVKLHSGGVCGVYGGGNQGDMVNDKTLQEAYEAHSDYIDISELLTTMNNALGQSKLISVPQKIGAMIAADNNSKIIADYVHGGCRSANVKHSCGVYLAGGSYYDVFAGNDVSGDIGSENDGATYTVITGNAVVHSNVYGGSDGYYHCDDRTGHYADDKLTMEAFNSDFDYDPFNEMVGKLIPTLQHSNIFVNGGLIKGNLVAGGVMANVGFPNDGTPKYKHGNEDERELAANKMKGTVRLEVAGNAEIRGNVFGGGAYASVWGLSQVYVHERPTILGSLFAGNDALGSVQSFLPFMSNLEKDKLPRSYLRYFYDVLHRGESIVIPHVAPTSDWEGLHADSLAYMTAHMTTDEKSAAETYYQSTEASSNGDLLNKLKNEANPSEGYDAAYSTYVLIEDKPVINSVYGSGNGAWDYGNDPEREGVFPKVYVCAGQEGNRPNQKSVFIDLHTSGGFIDTVFGGGNGCTVDEDGQVVVLVNNTALRNTQYPDSIATNPKFAHFKGGTSQPGQEGYNFVGTIFGGNNFSDMKTVPEIMLVKGNVKNIYGGGKAGNMTGKKTLYDIWNDEVKDVSTHVLSNSENITVTDSVFGGCHMSDVKGSAFVEVRKTSADGIRILYGGNEVSGHVGGSTRIDMAGGTVNRIYGGSNGQYDYIPVGHELYNVYRFGTYDAEHPNRGLIATAGRPDVDSAHVNLWGGSLKLSVFTGGSMANTRTTCLVVDDQMDDKKGMPLSEDITVKGTLFGGGEGRWDDLNARDNEGKRWGNITGSTHVHLHHAADVASAIAYGGGGGGDVENTYIKTYDTWETPFDKIFGGCWGADVYGTAHLEFNGVELTRYLFGGNDFSGNVYRSEIVVNSGRFFNVFGGGNGDYPDSYYTSQYAYDDVMCPSCPYGYLGARADAYDDDYHRQIERPNTEYVHITFNDGEVDSCLYGGGKMGTILPYKKDPTTSEYIYKLVDTNSVATATTEDDLQRFIPDTMRVAYISQYDENHTELTVSDPADLSYVVVNIHGGKFHRNAFAGGRGFKNHKKPIVYGLKVMNMDGGEIYESLYGGSEFVNDGYPAECRVPVDGSGDAIENPTREQRLAATSMRPSSILNLTGGQIGSNLYGTGYQGIVYGSSYVNIGPDAIDSCTVWRNHYGGGTADSTYKMFKPGYTGGQSDALATNKVTLKASIYSGANWGNASGAVTFDNEGFVGGESRLYLDGKGYNTTNDHVTSDPELVLQRSIFGSGTSVLGGDIHSNVEVRNYGGMEDCHPTKVIETIQRTDSLWLHNTAIVFTGTTDASQQYMSNRYSLKNIGYWNYRGYNVSELEAAVSDVEHLAFYEQGSEATPHSGEKFDAIEVPVLDINDDIGDDACGENKDICLKEYMVSPNDDTLRHTLIILDNGVNLTIGKSTNSGIDYGSVTGFGFVTTPGGYQSTITARPKMELSINHNMNDGGFVTTCNTSNRTRTPARPAPDGYNDVNTAWSNEEASYTAADELKYTNHATAIASGFEGEKYREWKVGDRHGLREAEATLLAHSAPQKLQQDWSMDITSGDANYTHGKHKFGIAEAVFEMPATTAGHYYQLTGEGFEMTGSNGEIVLVDSAWYPTLNASLATGGNVNMSTALSTINNWYSTGHLDPDTKGQWAHIPEGRPNEMAGSKDISKTPEYTFGLIMVPNNNFATVLSEGNYEYDMPALIDHDHDDSTDPVAPEQVWTRFIINGNARVNSVNNYCSPKVYNDAQNPEVKPSMRLYLTYDTTFASTFNGTVTFQMMEYDELGNEVAPIQVKIYIQTIIDELKSIDHNVLAMYNGGRTNTFSRKVELVPCGEERNLYITSIRWMPTNSNGGDTTAAATSSDFGSSDRFSLLGDSSLVWSTTDPSYPHGVPADHYEDVGNHSSHNRFAMAITPTNNVSEGMGMANGWIRGVGNRTNVYKLAYTSGTGATPVKTLQWQDNDGTEHDSVARVSLKNYNGNGPQGYFLGTLDGRGSAMIDVELTFDGTRTYDNMSGNGYVGKVILTMETFSEEDNESRGTFDVTIYVKTRAHGDTIYIASADEVTRQVAPNKSVTLWPYSNTEHHNPEAYQKSDIGKTPGMYVQSFRKALEDGIYEEGDVLCIIDVVNINDQPVHITGPNGPPIEVIRYEGHHYELPDEQCVYRGPMIVVSNGMSFTAENIAFHGSAGAKIKHIKRTGGEGDYDVAHDAVLDGSGNLQYWTYTYNNKTIEKLPDTNKVFAPIIQATGAGTTVNLREGTVVQHNWNAYGSVNLPDGTAGDQVVDATGMPTSTSSMGTISVTNGATLSLAGNIKVENNFSHTMDDLDDIEPHENISIEKAPGGAAIYVDGGKVELPESNRSTAVKITNNYLMDPHIHDIPSTVSWWRTITVDGVPERYAIDPTALSTWHHANVLLTREAPASGTAYQMVMNDSQSDVIVIKGTVGDETKIGVRKWFPGINERDTIRFATVTGGNNNVLYTAVTENKNFESDDHFRVFYNSAVDLTTAYLFRCATFRHQHYIASGEHEHRYVDPVYDYDPSLTLQAGDVLHFGAKKNLCPTGGDSIIYRIQGGMMPYTYTWSDKDKSVTMATRTTPYSNAQVQYDLKGGEQGTSISGAARYAKYAESMADTLKLPYETVNGDREWHHMRVTATDATGECTLYKDIDLRIKIDHSTPDNMAVTYLPSGDVADTASHTDNESPWTITPTDGWTDTARTTKAVASRNYTGVQITPRVWVNRSEGNITAVVAGDVNDYVYRWTADAEGDTVHELTNVSFCPGDTIYLYTEPRGSTNKFIMWDFDPYYRQLASYIVPAHDAMVTAYYGPGKYWHQHINDTIKGGAVYTNTYYYTARPTVAEYTLPNSGGNTTAAGYVTTYHGDVHIYNENGLAWFISVVNGLNDVQARQFYFNKVYLHNKTGGYDMKDYLWTPVGTNHQPFRGWFIGVGSDATTTDPLTGSKVSIKNIIVNEPNMDYAGFFGNIDTARISGISLESMLVRGAQYVGGLAASSKDARIDNVSVSDDEEDNNGSNATTILSTHYTSGGLIGISNNDKLTDYSSEAKYVGDAVYSGGVVGYGTSTTISNGQNRNDSRMSGLYIGGIAGYLDGTAPVSKGGLFRRKSAGAPSVVMNNYVQMTSNRANRVGGIVGYAKNSIIENNYFYGDVTGSSNNSGVASYLDRTSADGNYYQNGAAKRNVATVRNGSTVTNTSTFEGEGNAVTLAQSVHGRNNLTRVLNAWVREHNADGGDYKTWRSDLDDANEGFPIFGTPDMIPVHDSMTVHGCDSIEWNGTAYNDGDSLTTHVVDNVEMIDSTMVIRFVLHHGSLESVSDSATVGQAYEGYGFSLSEAETEMLREALDSLGTATLVLSDTLQTAYGCDSIITLTLTFQGTLSTEKPEAIVTHYVKVYPNPTMNYVSIEADGIQHVELYDNDGRLLENYDANGRAKITIDVTDRSTGAYYLRIHSAGGVTIQKLIKK